MSAPAVPLTANVVSEADVDAVLECYRSGWLTMGPRNLQFEEAFAARIGTRHAVTVGSSTAALHLALLGAQVGPGDEVLVSGLALGTARTAIAACGAIPVACDVLGPEDHTLDAQDVAGRITSRTSVLLADHRWGHPCDLGALAALCEERGILLVEDCTQAVGAKAADGSHREVGAAGLAACFSFSSGHQLPVGEGGMIVTDDDAVATRVRGLRSHAMTSVTWDRHRGHAETYDILDVGFNYRLDEPRAALALSQLPRLDAELDDRRIAVRAYHEALAGATGVTVPWPDAAGIAEASYFAFGVLLQDRPVRDRAEQALRDQGIAASAVMDEDDASVQALPQCAGIAERGLRLPLPAGLDAPTAERVAAAVRLALREP